ncbi:ferritin-like domain-containing protein [Larkinella insperata]|uniref:Ferritin-like domain-containing protein n=1 Tax=Larkinella insperata TaxID=332158 RepID=A0ABW3QER4_9BACT|nr:ferritin-like domain-containing protein [Larkinella insperata]
MEELTSTSTPKKGSSVAAIPSVERRMFLRALGLTTVSASAFLAACQNSINDVAPKISGARISAEGVSFGEGDFAILNYAYALEQLETAFYMAVIEKKTFPAGSKEEMVFKDIHDHELVHREFFKLALGSNAIGDLEFDVSSIDFSNRREVLNTARVLEDTGVAAYNGAGPLLSNSTFLTLAGKIVSVEARHAALISTILQPNGALFAGDYVVDNNGLERPLTISEVLGRAGKYIKTPINPASLLALESSKS